MNNLFAASFFNPKQTAIVIAVAVVGALLIILNVVLWYLWHRRKERKLYDRILQRERELLLHRLDDMRGKGDDGAFASQPAFFTNTVYVEVPVPTPGVAPVTEEVAERTEEVVAEALSEEPVEVVEESVEIVEEPVEIVEEEEEVRVEEAVSSEEEEEPEEGEESFADLDEDAEAEEVVIVNGYKIRYNRSFTARVIQGSEEFKLRYSDLKNYILSYEGVKGRVSWKHELFRVGRNSFLRFVVRGKTLCMCLATDPDQFEDTKYNVVDLRKRSPQAKYPTLFKVKGSRSLKQAKELVDRMMAELGLTRAENYVEERFVPPYQSTEELIEAKLIKVIGEVVPQTTENPVESPAEIPVETPATVEEPVPVEEVAAVEVMEIATEEVAAAEEVAETEEEVSETVETVEDFLPERDFEVLEEVDVTRVEVISDSEAESLIEVKAVKKQKVGGKKGIVNVDTLSKNYEAGAHVTVENLREKQLIAKDVKQVKVLAKGIVDKPLIVEANDFSIDAVKMIVLTGGRVIRTKSTSN